MQVSEKDDERDLQFTFQQALNSENTQRAELTHVMLCYIVGERNLSPTLPFGFCPHFWLNCRTRNLFFFLLSPLWECQPAKLPFPVMLSTMTRQPGLQSLSLLPCSKLSKIYFLAQVSDSSIEQPHI